MTTRVAASIRSRLLNRARLESDGTPFEYFLVRYACERFLYRLGASSMRERCVLKGASLLALWMAEPHRATRDIDLLADGKSDEETVRGLMATICSIPCPEDGLNFDLDTLKVSAIREGQRYNGQRASLSALLGTARITVQVDFGFGDEVTPGPEEARMPTLIDDVPAPLLRTYPMVSTIAEKFESMVQLGILNSRMKDFYDIWALSESFAFDGLELQQAVANCFDRRGTPLTTDTPGVLTQTFYTNPQLQDYWLAYGHKVGLLNSPPSAFETIGDRIESLLRPVCDSILAGKDFDSYWPPGGPWRPPSPRA